MILLIYVARKSNRLLICLKTGEYDIIDNDEEYKYLRIMRMEQVGEENIEKLRKKRDDKKKELDVLKIQVQKGGVLN